VSHRCPAFARSTPGTLCEGGQSPAAPWVWIPYDPGQAWKRGPPGPVLLPSPACTRAICKPSWESALIIPAPRRKVSCWWHLHHQHAECPELSLVRNAWQPVRAGRKSSPR
jgi:hypothetical protein